VLAGPVLFVISLALPLGMVIYSVIALTETRSGHNYRFPYIARWVESQMHGGSFMTSNAPPLSLFLEPQTSRCRWCLPAARSFACLGKFVLISPIFFKLRRKQNYHSLNPTGG